MTATRGGGRFGRVYQTPTPAPRATLMKSQTFGNDLPGEMSFHTENSAHLYTQEITFLTEVSDQNSGNTSSRYPDQTRFGSAYGHNSALAHREVHFSPTRGRESAPEGRNVLICQERGSVMTTSTFDLAIVAFGGSLPWGEEYPARRLKRLKEGGGVWSPLWGFVTPTEIEVLERALADCQNPLETRIQEIRSWVMTGEFPSSQKTRSALEADRRALVAEATRLGLV